MDFLDWVRRRHQYEHSGCRKDHHIILVAHSGAGFAHKILVEALLAFRLFQDCSNMYLCDSLISFKTHLTHRDSCSLTALAKDFAPKLRLPSRGDGVLRAKALREVSEVALSKHGISHEFFWRLSYCSMAGYARRLGLS